MGSKARTSPFAGIKADVIAITRAVPPGRVATFADIGGYMTVMPRHVAYILANLRGAELDAVPWHRVVASDGRVRDRPVDAIGLRQRDRLEAEGMTVAGGRVANMLERRVAVETIASGVRPGRNYGGRPR